MVPGKTYKPEDYLEIVWRRKWLLIIPVVLVASGTAIWTQFLENLYQSEALILIVPQQVPENFVTSTVTTPLDQRLNAINQQIQTRTRLEQIIRDLNLYADERRTMIMEDAVELMRGNISVSISRTRQRRGDPDSFTVGFESDSPSTAQKVAERLASLYVTENIQDRAVQSDQTTQFLSTQLEEARRQLEEHEQKLAEFRRRFDGQLPSQVSSNLMVIDGSQKQAQAMLEAISRDRERILAIDRQLATLSEDSAVPTQGPSPAGAPDAATPLSQQVTSARAAVKALEGRFKPDHPDLIRARRILSQLEARAEEEAQNAPIGQGAPTSAPTSPAQKIAASLQAEREAAERRIAANTAQEARLQQVMAAYRTRVEAAPGRQNEETSMMRDYDTLKTTYENLRQRYEQARIAGDLERRQIGEQFRMIDAPRLPQRPISPDRLRLNGLGAAAGVGLGLLLIGLIEYRDTSLRSDEDVALSLALPVLAVIPVMANSIERKRTKRLRVVAASAGAVLVLAAGAVVAVAWQFGLLDRWVR